MLELHALAVVPVQRPNRDPRYTAASVDLTATGKEQRSYSIACAPLPVAQAPRHPLSTTGSDQPKMPNLPRSAMRSLNFAPDRHNVVMLDMVMTNGGDWSATHAIG